MGLFDFTKKKEKDSTKKKTTSAKAAKPKKDDFELSEDGIKFTAIIEILGSPKAYVEETTKAFVKRIQENKDYHVYASSVSKPVAVEDKAAVEAQDVKEDLYSSYAEITLGTNKKAKLFDFCFDYMPSSIEVIEPMTTAFSANELSTFLTDIQGTLHKIDFALKRVSSANKLLSEKMQIVSRNATQILENNIILSLKQKKKDIKELAKNTGIPEDQLKPFIDKMMQKKIVVLEKDTYSLKK